MLQRYLLAFLYCVAVSLPALAQVPYTFTPGTPANAEQVNANFDTLVTQIEQLQTQIVALQALVNTPTTASIAGTYDFIELAIDVDQNGVGSYAIAGQSSTGTVVLNADGTGTVNSNEGYRQLSFFTQAKTVRDATGNGTEPINSTSVQLNTGPSSDSGTFTWSYSGNVLTVTDDHVMTFISAGGRIFINGGSDAEGRNSLIIVVRR